MRRGSLRVACLAVAFAASPAAQAWHETQGSTEAGMLARHQAVLDAGSDALVLLVAAHPDDRYVLPAVWLRYRYGVRVAVLLATRGGGGQNSIGPETGDALERIRTLETEAGCSHFQGEVWYLNRPDAGFRRTAAETYGEWGEEGTLKDLVRLIRTIRPDAILTTHHSHESHGHDLALVDLLKRAVPLAASAEYLPGSQPHEVGLFGIGATADGPATVTVPVNRLEPARGVSYRRLAWNILRSAHRTPGPPAALESVFEPMMYFELRRPTEGGGFPLDRLPSVFDDDLWPGTPDQRARLRSFLEEELPGKVFDGGAIAGVLDALSTFRALAADPANAANPALAVRFDRRIEALGRLLLDLSGVRLVLDVPPGTYAIAGEEFPIGLYAHAGAGVPVTLTVEGRDGVRAAFTGELGDEGGIADGRLSLPHGGVRRLDLSVRMPLPADGIIASDPMAFRFAGDRFVPPVRLRFHVALRGTEVPVDVTVPVEERAPHEIAVVPPLLLLPTSRRELQFSVAVVRNSRFPVEGDLEVRAPAGYAVQNDRRTVRLRECRGDQFQFAVRADEGRRSGVDRLYISFAGNRVPLPIHKVDVAIPDLRIGVLRGRDDTLVGILGVGGFGLSWSELSDADIAAADLSGFDTLVVDIRALRDRPDARRGFRRLLDFATGKGRRLVVFYHKDVEFDPPGEGFLGAPATLQPFHIGRARVTRADAPVDVLLPDHVLLRHPNTIEPWDWDGWQQERALYLPDVYGDGFEEVLEMHDPGQPPQRGALLYARTGEGEYVYCALALWRQLAKRHPGAVRLLANLLTPGT